MVKANDGSKLGIKPNQ